MEREFFSSDVANEPSHEYKIAIATVKNHVLNAIEVASNKIYNQKDLNKLLALKKSIDWREYRKDVADDTID